LPARRRRSASPSAITTTPPALSRGCCLLCRVEGLIAQRHRSAITTGLSSHRSFCLRGKKRPTKNRGRIAERRLFARLPSDCRSRSAIGSGGAQPLNRGRWTVRTGGRDSRWALWSTRTRRTQRGR
jgi:hypothetical protein